MSSPNSVILRCKLQVLEAHVTKHLDSGKVKGAFITFETQDDLARALALQGEVSHQQDP
jgi:hypothetical protein